MAADERRVFNGQLVGSISRSPEQKRRRSGSFSASLAAIQDDQQVGRMKIEHSESRGVTTVTDLENMRGAHYKGVGSALFHRAEHVAKAMGSTHLETTLTAQEAQGFYRKMGMAPAPELLAPLKAAYAESGQAISDDKLEAMVPTWRKPV